MGVASHLLSRWYKLVDSLLHAFFFRKRPLFWPMLPNGLSAMMIWSNTWRSAASASVDLLVSCDFPISDGKGHFSYPLGIPFFVVFFFAPIFNREKTHGPMAHWSHFQLILPRHQDRVKAGKALSREEREMFSAAFKARAKSAVMIQVLLRTFLNMSHLGKKANHRLKCTGKVGKICGGDIWYMLVPRVSLLYLERFPTKKGVLECEIVVMRCFCQSKNHGRVPWAAVDWRSV